MTAMEIIIPVSVPCAEPRYSRRPPHRAKQENGVTDRKSEHGNSKSTISDPLLPPSLHVLTHLQRIQHEGMQTDCTRSKDSRLATLSKTQPKDPERRPRPGMPNDSCTPQFGDSRIIIRSTPSQLSKGLHTSQS